ncbi:MAG: GDSL-type esterase/lipase family protein, partial [Spirochaetota bacterium]
MSIRTIYIVVFVIFTSCYHAKKKKTDLLPLLASDPAPIAVTVLGDSLSFRSNAFSLQERLGTNYFVRNLAIEGRTTRDWLQEINLVFESQVNILVIELGTNDAIQLSAEEYQKNINDLIMETQQRSDARIFLTAVPSTEETSIRDLYNREI